MNQTNQPQEPSRPEYQHDEDPRDQVYEGNKGNNPSPDISGPNWTMKEEFVEAPKVEPRPQDFEGQTESQAEEDDWTEQSLKEIKEGLKQISSALKDAFEHGKEDPRLKKFGDDVRDSFNKISDEIGDFFKKL